MVAKRQRDKRIAFRAVHIGDPRAYYIQCGCERCKSYFSDLIALQQRGDARAELL